MTILSTIFGIEPKDNAAQWNTAQKKKIQVPWPAAVREYNQQMGGTDCFNQNLNKFRVGIGGKKFYWHIFTWLLDASVVNAWSLHRMAGGTLDQLKFCHELVQFLL